MLMIPFINQFYMLVINQAFQGIFEGIYLSFIIPIACDIAGSSQLANQAIGYYHMSISIPVTLGPVVAGLIYDSFHSYQYAFYFGGFICILSGLMQIFFLVLTDLIKIGKKVLNCL